MVIGTHGFCLFFHSSPSWSRDWNGSTHPAVGFELLKWWKLCRDGHLGSGCGLSPIVSVCVRFASTSRAVLINTCLIINALIPGLKTVGVSRNQQGKWSKGLNVLTSLPVFGSWQRCLYVCLKCKQTCRSSGEIRSRDDWLLKMNPPSYTRGWGVGGITLRYCVANSSYFVILCGYFKSVFDTGEFKLLCNTVWSFQVTFWHTVWRFEVADS
jgi:hypothetical protein